MSEAEEIEKLKRLLEEKESQLARYEGDGVAKLFYSLNRKASEMAEMLNSVKLQDLPLEDAKDKSFERVFKLLEKSEAVATSTKTLGSFAGITGDEEKDTSKRPFIEKLATKRD